MSLQDGCVQDAACSSDTSLLLHSELLWGYHPCVVLEYPLPIEWNTCHACVVSSGQHHPSGFVQFPLLLMGKLHLLCCDWQMIESALCT